MADDDMTLFDEQLKLDVMTFGWIHTHPQFVRILLTKFSYLESLLKLSRLAQSTRISIVAA
jgi:hypothetical protein